MIIPMASIHVVTFPMPACDPAPRETAFVASALSAYTESTKLKTGLRAIRASAVLKNLIEVNVKGLSMKSGRSPTLCPGLGDDAATAVGLALLQVA